MHEGGLLDGQTCVQFCCVPCAKGDVSDLCDSMLAMQ